MAYTRLIDVIEPFLELSGMSATRFGTDCCGDPNFVGRLRKGRSPTEDTIISCNQFIENWIKGNTESDAGVDAK